MTDDWKDNLTPRDYLLSSTYGILMVFQIILYFFFYQNEMGIDVLVHLGFFLWCLSALFGVAPIIIFRRRGGVARGESYMMTTKIVDTGIYSIVRHPQYLAGFLLIIALALMTQHWLSLVAGIIAFIAFYLDTLKVDHTLIEKFGDGYKEYIRRVPKFNFLLGILKKIGK